VHEIREVNVGAPVVSFVCAKPDSVKHVLKAKASKRTWARVVVSVMVLKGFG
jgi:hypothetical protein